MALADTALALALRLINKYGNTVIITQEIQGTYNPTTSSNPVTTQTMTVKGLPEEYAESIRFLGEKLNSSGIVEGDKKVSIAGSGIKFIPAVGDKANVTELTYGVIGVATIELNDVTPLIVLHLRKI